MARDGSKPKMALAMMGNQHRVACKTPEERQIAYQSYCDHIASGWPKQAWCLEHPDYPHLSCTWETMEKYMKGEHASEFEPDLMKQAEAKRYQHWFGKGQKLMEGQYKHGSPVVWQTIMRNIFRKHGWDNFDKKIDSGSVNAQFEGLMNQIDQARSSLNTAKIREIMEAKSQCETNEN